MYRKCVVVIGALVCSFAAGWQAVPAAQSWTKNGPVARTNFAAVLDPTTDLMIVFGGASATNLNDVWWSDLTVPSPALSWTPVAASGTPPAPRNGHSGVYDPASNRMIVFGGGLGFSSPCVNEVWILDHANGTDGTPTWLQLNPSGSAPAPRTWHNAVYDPNTNRMIVLGGQNCFSTTFGDVWVLSNANGLGGAPQWTQLFPTGGNPGGRRAATAVYKPATNNLILFGGATQSSDYPTDVWVLSNANGIGTPAWTQLTPTGGPPPNRAGHVATYDLTNNIMTIYGGAGLSGRLSDSWVLTNADGTSGNPAWSQLGPLPGAPFRFFASAVYDAVANTLVLFGGESQAPAVDDRVFVLSNANGLP